MGAAESLTNIADSILGAPSDLPQLENISQVSPRVIRVLGQNPGQATLQGTNTYIIGKGRRRALIDTSDGNARWWPMIEKVLTEHDIVLETVVLTHRHSDHIGGVAAVCKAFPDACVWKAFADDSHRTVAESPVPPVPDPPQYELEATGDNPTGAETEHSELGKRGARFCTKIEGQRQWRSECGCQDGVVSNTWRALEQGQLIYLECGSKLRIISTPGHTEDSICVVLVNANAGDAEGTAIFTGDTVLGGRTARFDDLKQYETSLSRIRSEVSNAPRELAALFPGHGAMISAGNSLAYLDSLISAQTKRRRAVITALREHPGSSVDDICGVLYDSMAAQIMAKKIIEQTLHVLEADKKAIQHSTFFGTTVWELVE